MLNWKRIFDLLNLFLIIKPNGQLINIIARILLLFHLKNSNILEIGDKKVQDENLVYQNKKDACI